MSVRNVIKDDYHVEMVSKYNITKLLKLKVNMGQQKYVSNIRNSLIQASFLKKWRGYVLMINSEVIGFGSFANYDKNPNTTKIYKIMIDKEYQGMGLGKLLLENIITRTRGVVYIEVHSDNVSALNLYKKYFNIVSDDGNNTLMILKKRWTTLKQ